MVQEKNYSEMGDAVDLAKLVSADQIFFDRMSNWGTFDDFEFRKKSIFMGTHPKFEDFLHHLGDDRLNDPIVFKESFSDLLPEVNIRRAELRSEIRRDENLQKVWQLQVLDEEV